MRRNTASRISHRPYYVLLKQPAENVFDFRLKDCWAQSHGKLIDDDSLGQVKFLHLFKVIVLRLIASLATGHSSCA